MRLLFALALAHGDRFGTSALSVVPGEPDVVWGVAGGWGLVRTVDGGASWAWWCEEGLDGRGVSAVLAESADAAWVGTDAGLVRVEGCEVTAVAGAERPVVALARADGAVWAVLRGETGGETVRCDASGCVADGPAAEGWSPKSLRGDGDTLWLTATWVEDRSGELWRRADGRWEKVLDRPAGADDLVVLHADGERLLAWELSRDPEAPPRLLLSTDGGVSFAERFSGGSYADPPPGLVVLPDGFGMYLGTDVGRTWYSPDRGWTWAEVSGSAPVIRCGAGDGTVRYACTDHWADGHDVARLEPGAPWLAAGCLDEVGLEPCVADTCADYLPALAEAGAYGGGQCLPEPEPEPGCGGVAVVLVAALPLGWRRRRLS